MGFEEAFGALGGGGGGLSSSSSATATSGDTANRQNFTFGGSVGGDFNVSGIGTNASGSVSANKSNGEKDAMTFILVGLGFVLVLGALNKIS